jgi:hypothetical protein
LLATKNSPTLQAAVSGPSEGNAVLEGTLKRL